MATYYTPIVDGTDNLDAAVLNAIFQALDDQIVLNAAAILAKTGYTSAQMLIDLKANDGAGSGVDADTVDGYEASALIAASTPLNDLPAPNRYQGVNATTLETVSSFVGSTRACMDRDGTVWANLWNGNGSATVRKYPARDLSAGANLDLGVASYEPVDLCAVGGYVYVLLTDYTSAPASNYPGTVGKVACIDISTGALLASWGTAGILDLVDAGTDLDDPWSICTDGTYLFIACMMDPGRVARVTISSEAISSFEFGANYPRACAVELMPDSVGTSLVVVGFDQVVTGQIYGCLAVLAKTIVGASYYNFDGVGTGDQLETWDLFYHAGTLYVGNGDGTEYRLLAVNCFDYSSGANLKYNHVGYDTVSGGTLAECRGIAAGPAGELFVVDSTANGDLIKYWGAAGNRRTVQEVAHQACGAGNSMYGVFHDGRSLWTLGDNGTIARITKIGI